MVTTKSGVIRHNGVEVHQLPPYERAALGIQLVPEERRVFGSITVQENLQLAPAIAVSRAIRERFPGLPIAWGGYFPTLNTEAAIGSSYVEDRKSTRLNS